MKFSIDIKKNYDDNRKLATICFSAKIKRVFMPKTDGKRERK